MSEVNNLVKETNRPGMLEGISLLTSFGAIGLGVIANLAIGVYSDYKTSQGVPVDYTLTHISPVVFPTIVAGVSSLFSIWSEKSELDFEDVMGITSGSFIGFNILNWGGYLSRYTAGHFLK